MKRHYNGNLYELNEEFMDYLRSWKGYLIVFGGPSGVGKTTLSEKMPYATIRSLTTRERRKEYETYDFVSKEEFEKLYNNNEIACLVKFNTDSYGFTLDEFKKLAEKNSVIVLTLSPLGYRLLKQRYSRTIGVFVHAKEEKVMKRLLNRDGFLEDIRVKSYRNNMRSKDFYHIKVNNSHPFLFIQTLRINLLIKLVQTLDFTKKTHKLRKKIFKTKTHRLHPKKKKHFSQHSTKPESEKSFS